jgi:hypothetical protein
MSEARITFLQPYMDLLNRLFHRPEAGLIERTPRISFLLKLTAVAVVCALLMSCASILQVFDPDDTRSPASGEKAGTQKRIPRPPMADDFNRN